MTVKLAVWLCLMLLCTQPLYVFSVVGSTARGLSTTDGSKEHWELSIRDKSPSITSVSMKGGKGKGAYGGANIVHRPSPRSSKAPALLGPSFVISIFTVVSFGFIYA